MRILILTGFLFYTVNAITQMNKKLDAVLKAQASGIALMIEEDGKIIYQNTTGSANDSTGEKIDAATNFRMASVSKQFTAMGILLLEKQHQLSFDDPIKKYLTEIPANIGNRILIKHLLTHSSGLIDYEELMPAMQTAQLMDADVLKLLQTKDSTYFTPGSKFRYSNSGFCLLALIIEKVSHQSFASFIKEKIFVPLHMDASTIYEPGKTIQQRAMGYAKDSAGNVYFSDQSITSATKGDGGVYTSLNDYIKWIHALEQNKLLNLDAVLKHLRFEISDNPESYYAAGWFETASQPKVLFHSGSTCGFNNFVIYVPQNKLLVTFFSNLADNLTPFKHVINVLKEEGIADFSEVLALHDLTR